MQQAVVTQEQIQNFKMPKVNFGEIVAWYPSGLTSDRPETAHVIRVSGRNVHLATATKGVREAVRHIDDPKLKLNADQREMGAWDFTTADKARRQEIADLRREISAIHQQITGLISSVMEKNEAKGGLSEYQELRKQAIDAGIKVEGNPSKKWLQEQLDAVE